MLAFFFTLGKIAERMKVWIKYLIGIILGIIIAIVAGKDNESFFQTTQFLTDLALQIGRYAIYPILFFGFALGIYNLAETKRLGKVLIFCFCFAILSAFLFSGLGITSFFIMNPSRIPILVENATALPQFSFSSFLLATFPSSPFSSFTESLFLLPICFFAFCIGLSAASIEKSFAKHALTIFDSFARIAYSMLTFFVDFYAIFLTIISIQWFVQLRTIFEMGFFTDIIILLLVDLVILFCGVYPLIIKLICKEANPFKVLYASLATFLCAITTTDSNVTLVTNLRHCHESLGIRRRISNVATPLLTIFAKPGSALVLSVSFLVIFKSYSNHSMGVKSLLLLLLLSSVFSLVLSQFSIGGTYIALATICLFFGSAYEQGYLILKPMAFFLGAIATAIDAFAAMVGSYILAYQTDMALEKDLRFFI